MAVAKIREGRIARAKRAFTTRRVPTGNMKTLIDGAAAPRSGDLVLATIQEIGKQRKIEQPSGRRAQLLLGDEIIVCYGNRYAPDQYEALVSEDLGLCDLVAAGGVAGREVNRHDRMPPPTKIMPVGLIGDERGRRLNLVDYRIGSCQKDSSIKVIAVVGTAMNSGKTFTAASIIHSLKPSRYRVAGVKATGTGSGGDIFLYRDMGADVVMDFTDGGFSSTYLQPDDEIESTALDLIDEAARQRCQFAVMEIADGLRHTETATLLQSKKLQSRIAGVVFAAYDSMGAKTGYDVLREWGYDVLAVSGQLTRSPLAMRETKSAVATRILTPFEIQAGALLTTITGDEAVNVLPANRHGHRYEPVNRGANTIIYNNLALPNAVASLAAASAQYNGFHDTDMEFSNADDIDGSVDDFDDSAEWQFWGLI